MFSEYSWTLCRTMPVSFPQDLDWSSHSLEHFGYQVRRNGETKVKHALTLEVSPGSGMCHLYSISLAKKYYVLTYDF